MVELLSFLETHLLVVERSYFKTRGPHYKKHSYTSLACEAGQKYTKKIKLYFASSWLNISLSRNSPSLLPITHIIGGLILNPANKIPYVAKEDTASINNIPKL